MKLWRSSIVLKEYNIIIYAIYLPHDSELQLHSAKTRPCLPLATPMPASHWTASGQLALP